jgi:ribonuclease-3
MMAGDTAALAARLGVELADTTLLELACVHGSFAAEHHVESNQRLEFLGDAVLDLIVAEHLYATHPELDEGGLSKARIAVVNETVLAQVAEDLGLGDSLRMGRGAESEGLRTKPSVLSDALEAVIGAISLSAGHEAASRFVLSQIGQRLEAAAENPGAGDFKSLIHEWAQATYGVVPSYEISTSGPAHDPRFVASLVVGGETLGVGEGRSKKASEMEAAKAAWGVVGHA